MNHQTSDQEQTPDGRKKSSRGKSLFDIFYAPLLVILIGVILFLIARAILPHISAGRQQASSGSSAVSSAAKPESLPDHTTENTAEQTGNAASESYLSDSESESAGADSSVTEQSTTASSETAATVVTSGDPNVMNPSLLIARNALLFQVGEQENRVIYERDPDAKIYPASMTKMMTLLTFLSIVPEDKLDDHTLMTKQVVNAQYARGALQAGFQPGESCKIRDLIYAMMLPSGAEAAVMLAIYASGTEKAFVEQMNQKAAEMGLTGTCFINCTGLHEDGHYSTVRDISKILLAAIQNPFIKEVMSTREYTTEITTQHPKGIRLLSTTLTRMVGNELEGMSDPLHVIGGKTGFTKPAGQCLATWAQDAAGNTFVCIVAGSTVLEPLDAIGDTLTLYQLVSEQPGSVRRIQPVEADLPDYVH